MKPPPGLRRRLEALEQLAARRPDNSWRARVNLMTTAEKVARLAELTHLALDRDAAAVASGLSDPPISSMTKAIHARLDRALDARADDWQEGL